MEEVISVIVGKYKKPITLSYKGARIFLHFGYNKALLEEVRNMDGAKWHGFDDPPVKMWSIANSERNHFQLEFLQGLNPYAKYDRELLEFTPNRSCMMSHQIVMAQHAITRQCEVLACEMGTGKTLAYIEVMEWIQRTYGLTNQEAWYVGPRGGVKAVGRELNKWQSLVKPVMYTYEGLVKVMKDWKDGTKPPKIVCYDESSKIKNPTSQRGQAARHLANAIRDEWKEQGFVVEMTGTPAPKSPIDWWNQAEVACPGFLKEGNINKLKKSLSIIEEAESLTGGVYQRIVSWLDDDKKCAKCGEYKEHENHNFTGDHGWVPSVNEVHRLYKRMRGLVLVQFKKDCLDLPDKQYRIIKVQPTMEMLRAAKIIKAKSTRAIEALSLCRELSDGFQYTDVKTGDEPCPNCGGIGTSTEPVYLTEVDVHAPNTKIEKSDVEYKEIRCPLCIGTGTVPKYERGTDTVSSPKDEVLVDLLDEHEEIGRLIVWGGFTATIDRVTGLAHQNGWATLRVDGRGYFATDEMGRACNSDEFLDALDLSNPKYKELLDKHPKICFVGHPKAGGMALTLTASPTEIFYSNSFDGEARMQSEDRFHRTGMDKNRGATIIDIICLPTDQLVLDNLKKKKKLQDMTMDELSDAFTNTEKEVR